MCGTDGGWGTLGEVHVDQWLQLIPPLAVYLLAGAVVGIESLGIPFPGEIVLVSAALLSSRHELAVSWEWIAVAGSIGAMVGDSIGYAIGRRFGSRLFDWLGRRFPRHFGPDHVLFAEHVFQRWGLLAVFFGRFIAVLRIFAGPLAGALIMSYRRFLAANVLGGIMWATGTTAAIYYLGVAAETALSRFSYVALAVAVLIGIAASIYLRKKMNTIVATYAQRHRGANGAYVPPGGAAAAPSHQPEASRTDELPD